jgi:hypothetical protein
MKDMLVVREAKVVNDGPGLMTTLTSVLKPKAPPQGVAASGRVAAPGRGSGLLGICPKLTISEPRDAFEEDADRVADRVMAFPSPGPPPPRIFPDRGVTPQRKCASCEEEEGTLNRKQTSEGPRAVPPIVHDVLRSAGRPLDPAVRAFMEPRFGHDFGEVRVHTDARAASSASAIDALAYAWGNSIVFGPGQHRPETGRGRHLLAHELAHIVQQARHPARVIHRKATQEDEDKKKIAVRHHEDQQKSVVRVLSNALKIKPDPAKGPLDSDTLFHNTAELVDKGKTTLKVLTPTHYSQLTDPIYFDDRVTHPIIKGDYPADPALKDAGSSVGLVRPPAAGTAGQTDLPTQPIGFTPAPPKEERTPERVDPTYREKRSPPPKLEPTAPGKTTAAKPVTPPVIAWSPAEVRLFTGTKDVTEAELRNTFVHEGQHVADWIYLRETKPGSWENALELYKSEFRAFWVQPPVPRECADCPIPEEGPFPGADPIKKSEKQRAVTLTSGQTCDACGGSGAGAKGSGSAPASRTTAMRNERQQSIFWHLLARYPQNKFDCFYVCSNAFGDAVDAYDSPAGINLVNSARLIELSVELQKLTPAMTRAEVAKTTFHAAIERLDAIDWLFLKDKTLSGPFWKSVEGFAAKPLAEALHALATKGSPSAEDISQGLQKALAKLKAS